MQGICFPAFATMYAEYKFVERVHERTGAVSPCLNKASFAIGVISCVGMCLVATFQVCLIQLQRKILSECTRFHVIPNLYGFLSLVEHKKDHLKSVFVCCCVLGNDGDASP